MHEAHHRVPRLSGIPFHEHLTTGNRVDHDSVHDLTGLNHRERAAIRRYIFEQGE